MVWDNFTKLVTNKSMTILWLWTVTNSTFFLVLCHFVILYMVSMEIVSFYRIIPLCNFQYRNHVHSITLILFQIILQTWYKYKAWLDDMQRLRTVTSLDVSAVAGHHAIPAALLFLLKYVMGDKLHRFMKTTSFCSYARPAQPGPNRTRLWEPCIAAVAGD